MFVRAALQLATAQLEYLCQPYALQARILIQEQAVALHVLAGRIAQME